MDKHWLPDEQLQIPPGFIMLERSRDHVLAFCPDSTMGRYVVWTIGRDGILHTGYYSRDPRDAANVFELKSGEVIGG